MTRRLVKIAKELNVGTTSIIKHLLTIGFEVENKPTAKISDEMYEELLKEFQSSLAVKEKADQLIIGGRPSARKETGSVAGEPTTGVPPKKEIETKIEKEPEKVKEEIFDGRTEIKSGIKVVGKIDLEQKPAAEEIPKAEPEQPDTEEEETSVIEDKKEVMRHETPQLKGLKILGKIDTEKFEKAKKEKSEEDEIVVEENVSKKLKVERKQKETKRKETPKVEKDGAEGAPSQAKPKKRRRRRKKVVAETSDTDQRERARKPRKTEEPKEVTQKEIEEKIKATMARLSAGKQRRRQKIRRDKREVMREKHDTQQLSDESKALQLTEFVTVQELANLIGVSATEIITTCMNLGVIVSINQRLDAEIIELLAEEFGHEIEFVSAEEDTDLEEEIEDKEEDLTLRPPIVTVMGHVDHGKTSLLDFIRKANVVGDEAGGITQHIGAYEFIVDENEKSITFLDTPGHEAFTAMRARGAKLTDIVVIIISADDNIMPQTKEAISHAQAAGVPIIFAINKIDKPGADPEKIKQELSAMNLLVEDWGGKIQSQDISAKTGQNVDQLLEKIILEADLLELKANPDRPALGTVIEASLDKGRGFICKLLVQNGTLKVGDSVVSGEHSGKVKAMFNERGKRIKHSGPSKPVMILGLNGAPQAGEKFKVMESEHEARSLATRRAQINREQANRATKRISLEEIGRRLALGTFKELNLIVKGDVDGSVEALSDSLIKMSQKTVLVNVIHKAVGQIIESDVLLASASDAIIVGFQVRPSIGARKLAEQEGVEIKTYSIIYEAIEEIKSAIEGLLEPTREEKIVAHVNVKEVYKISKVGTVAGCFIEEGKLSRDNKVRVVRDGIVIYPTKGGVVGEVASLKRFKDDVKEVKSGLECGITIKNYNDIKVGDVIEGFEIIEIKQTMGV